MEKLKKYVTRKNLAYGNLALGIIALILVLLYFTAVGNASSLSDMQGALSTMRNMCNLFYVVFILLLGLVAGYAFRLFQMKDKIFANSVLFGCDVFALVMAFISLPAVQGIHAFTKGDLGKALAYSGSMSNSGTILVLMVIACLISAGFSIYVVFVKKTEEIDVQNVKEDLAQGVKNAGETISKAGESASQNVSKMSDKIKAYYQTEKGKKNVLLIGAGALVVVALIVGVSIYNAVKRTPIDLTKQCEVSFEGVSGEGQARISCEPDYDHTNSDIEMFVNDVTYSVEKDGKLKNGDKVVVKAQYSEATADSCKLKVENTEKEFVVEGLEVVYKKFAEVPKKVSGQFESEAQKALDKYLKQEYTDSFFNDDVSIESTKLIAVYYMYNDYDRSGKAYYLYRASLLETEEEYSEKFVEYYYVPITDINTREDVDFKNLSARKLYMYADELSDQLAIDEFKENYSGVEVVKEQPDGKIYKEERIENAN